MDFLREKLALSANVPGPSKTFFADIVQPRPDFEVLSTYAGWGARVQQEVLHAGARKNCQLAWIGVFVDEKGVALVLQCTRGIRLNEVKLATHSLTRTWLDDEMQGRLWVNLHALDEIDRRRIEGWKTPTSLCPSGLKRKREEGDRTAGATARADQPPAKRTRAQFLAENDHDSDHELDCPPAPTLLCIQDRGQSELDSIGLLRDLPSLWQHRVKLECTVVVAEVGNRPTLTFINCIHEDRRIELMVQTARDEYDQFSMVAVVRVAAALAKAGAIPSADGPRSRKSDFLKRCATALKALDENAECELTKLSTRDQNSIRVILSGKDEPFSGCFSPGCVDRKPTWTTQKICVRCSHCNTPMSFGRTWTTGYDQVREEYHRQRMEMDEARIRSKFNKQTHELESWVSEDEPVD